jgi:uncharacterized protein DUF4410
MPRTSDLVGTVGTVLALTGMTACARTSTEGLNVQGATPPKLPKPQLILVHDFTASADGVALDSGVIARLRRMNAVTSEEEQHIQVGQEVAQALTKSLVKRIGQLGIAAAPASAGPSVTGPTLAIDGQILTIDEGNKTRRMVVGFGVGASEVRALVQVYETIGAERRFVEDFYTTAKSSRKPGMGPMAGAGAAAGHAASSAGVATGVGVLTEHSQTVEGDAANMAKEIAKTLASFFVQQGWITQDQAERARFDP